MKNVAVILAGGIGSRFGLNIPKQFGKIAGKTILEHTLSVFQNNDLIDEICIVGHPDWIWKIEEIVNINNFNKVSKIIEGGKERKDSSLNAIKAYSFDGQDLNLIFHDAVRPFVDDRIINDCINALSHYNAVDVAIPAVDTIIEVENNIIQNIPNREKMMQGQTPQCFRLSTIKKAYENAQKDINFKPTDDCGVVKKYLPEEKIYVVKGSYKNIKITHPQDIFLADKLFQLKTLNFQEKLSDEFYKEKLRDKVVVVFGGSYGIGKEILDLAAKYNAKTYGFSRSLTNTDVSSISDVQKALEYVYNKENRIDFVVNTASILNKKSIENMSYNEILDIININYVGAVNIAKESIKYLENTKGQLLNFTSSSYTRGRANYALYSSTKAAIVNLTQALAEEWYHKGVKVNCINPERTRTPMRIKNFGEEDPNTLLKSEDVAFASLNALVSDVTGQIIDVKVQKVKINE